MFSCLFRPARGILAALIAASAFFSASANASSASTVWGDVTFSGSTCAALLSAATARLPSDRYSLGSASCASSTLSVGLVVSYRLLYLGADQGGYTSTVLTLDAPAPTPTQTPTPTPTTSSVSYSIGGVLQSCPYGYLLAGSVCSLDANFQASIDWYRVNQSAVQNVLNNQSILASASAFDPDLAGKFFAWGFTGIMLVGIAAWGAGQLLGFLHRVLS